MRLLENTVIWLIMMENIYYKKFDTFDDLKDGTKDIELFVKQIIIQHDEGNNKSTATDGTTAAAPTTTTTAATTAATTKTLKEWFENKNNREYTISNSGIYDISELSKLENPLTPNQYIIINAENVTITGVDNNNDNTITLANGHGGLIQNGTSNDTAKACTIENIKVKCVEDGTLEELGGGICRAYFGRNLENGNILIDNCHFIGGTIGKWAGGICGSDCGTGMTSGELTIQNCSNTGNIGEEAGGICGIDCGPNMEGGSLTIQNCSNTGTIEGSSAGGICGPACGLSMSGDASLTIQNCSNTGNIGEDAGGICGSSCGYTMTGGSLTIQNCSSDGTIEGKGGGICGSDCGNKMTGGELTIQNCLYKYDGDGIINVNNQNTIVTTKLVGNNSNVDLITYNNTLYYRSNVKKDKYDEAATNTIGVNSDAWDNCNDNNSPWVLEGRTCKSGFFSPGNTPT